jgi:hypothetical protein
MTDHSENETTKQLPVLTVEARLSGIEATLVAQNTLLAKMDAKLDTLLKMQQDMYVDLRGRFTPLENELRQIKQDIQPDSFQNRLMRMGQ